MRAFLQLCFLRFFPAWFLAFILASVFHSHFVLFELVALNIDIPITKWAYMVFADMRGLALTYGIIIAVALAISFFIAHLLLNRLKKTDNSSAGQSKSNAITIFMFGVAGAVGFFVMLVAMQPILNVTLIAGARTWMGIIAQCFAGFVSGICYAKLS
ncbi:MAG: hypothetical protein CL600_04255 [Alteromonas sp.]|jgi:hypothetical protein|uniref:hypothetical protein n=1 Tax=Alteromonas sp. MB-3u-76 TaxID=2058133 RepID=UPI000C30B4AA|nr:hypothetical protein [Alteromonas sp. MB-3u-76]AUC87348.1 hypothetical protein CW735_03310 [Alteromonas sp. MB-3u-76]MAI64085.1 hypothetical protein [Alteromonas sp.]